MKPKILLLSLLLLAACSSNNDPSYIVQVSLGGWNKPEYTAQQVIGRLDTVCSRIPVSSVIIGWSTDRDIYKEVGNYLHGKGIDMYLWLPVFAETEEVCESSPAVDLWGGGPAEFNLKEGEGFRFNCPSDPENVANVIGIYDRYFAGCGFDGVFLDRIRTQSFVGGAMGVLSCGCPECERRFMEEGVKLEDVRRAWEAAGSRFLSVNGYSPIEGFTFSNPLAEAFFRAKGHIVSSAVADVAEGLRARGLKVGMDLFAPFMAPFVGQDYRILAAHADFIKPMLYRMTNAPAGMGFEYELLKEALPDATGYPEFGMDVEFLHSQLEAMEPSPCRKFPGIEINYRADVAPTSPEYVAESVGAVLQHGFDGAVLSWNIMEVPLEHLDAVARH